MLEPRKVYHRQALSPSRARSLQARSQAGSQLSEFAAGLVLLVAVAFVPLLDLAIVPIRWMMAQEIINSYVRTLALCETYSESLRAMEADPSMRTQLLRLGGVGIKTVNLNLKITRVSRSPSTADSLEVSLPGCIPRSWLPDGSFAPCVYLLNINVEASIAPAILMKSYGKNVPGLTEPIPVMLTASHEWTNLGRDPSNEKFFINE